MAAAASDSSAATSLTQTSVTPSNQQTPLSSSMVLQKPTVAAPMAMPYAYQMSGMMPYGLSLAAYDPKTMMAAATNKLKVLSSPQGMKLDQRYAPY